MRVIVISFRHSSDKVTNSWKKTKYEPDDNRGCSNSIRKSLPAPTWNICEQRAVKFYWVKINRVGGGNKRSGDGARNQYLALSGGPHCAFAPAATTAIRRRRRIESIPCIDAARGGRWSRRRREKCGLLLLNSGLLSNFFPLPVLRLTTARIAHSLLHCSFSLTS